MNLRITAAIVCFTACVVGSAAPPPEYYGVAEGKTGQALRQALHAIIRNHTVIPYSGSGFDTSDALKVLDEDPRNTNNVSLLYAPRSVAKTAFGQTTGWNREHIWPNSYGLDDRHPAYSDLFNLRAEDVTVNNERANKLFDTSDTNSPSYQFPAHPEAPLCSTDSDSWEPPEFVKGDIARALFYMDVRYAGTLGEPDSILVENTAQISSTTNLMGKLSTLLAWHALDPVSDAERQRNDTIFSAYQHNRNPFVDHPQWVDRVFRPVLMIVRTESTVEISWEAAFSTAVVEAKSTLSGSWAVAGTATNRNGRLVSGEPLAGRSRFYRLR